MTFSMRRVIAIVLFWSSLVSMGSLLLPSDLQASGNKTKQAPEDSVFVYDAVADSLLRHPSALPSHARVSLVVYHPNIFRYNYALGLQGTDYHTATVPKALGDLFLVVGPTSASTRTLAGGKETLPPSLQSLFDATKDAQTAEQSALANLRKTPLDQGLDYSALRKAWVAPTNHEARWSILEAFGQAYKQVNGTDLSQLGSLKDAAQRVQRAFIENYLPDLPANFEKSAAQYRERKQERATAFANWKAAADQWIAEHDSAADAAALKLVKGAVAWMDDQDKAMQAVERQADDLIAADRLVLANLTSLVSFCVESPSADDSLVRRVQPIDHDELKVSVTRTPRSIPLPHTDATSAYLQALPPDTAGVTHEARAYVYHRWVLDFSAGLGITGLVDPGYYAASNPDTSRKDKIVRADAGDSHVPVPVAFGHMLYSMPKHFATGPALGVSITDPIRYLVGWTLQYGARIRGDVTSGLASGKTPVLQGQTLNQPITDGTDVRTRSALRTSWFAAFTFTINI